MLELDGILKKRKRDSLNSVICRRLLGGKNKTLRPTARTRKRFVMHKREPVISQYFIVFLVLSHLLHGLEAEDVEALGENLRGCVAQHDALHVDPDDVAGLVLLDAVAVVVELGEGRGHLVHELAERVQEEVVGDL